MRSYSYRRSRNPVVFVPMAKRHSFVRSIMREGRALDVGCHRFKIASDAIGLDNDSQWSPDIVGDVVHKIPLPKGFFDCVTMLELIEHLTRNEQRKALQEINRVLKIGGQLIVSTPNISRATRKINRAARAFDDFFLMLMEHHTVCSPRNIYSYSENVHAGEMTHDELKVLLNQTNFKIIREQRILTSYIVEAEKAGNPP